MEFRDLAIKILCDCVEQSKEAIEEARVGCHETKDDEEWEMFVDIVVLESHVLHTLGEIVHRLGVEREVLGGEE